MSFFSIIITTHKKAEKLQNAVYSVLLQTYQNFEVIIVNDSPEDKEYDDFEKNIKDHRIIYIKNEKNYGVNFSKNKAISSKSIKSDWVIFLDDDDILSKDALEMMVYFINENRNTKWIISNKTTKDNTSLTKIDQENTPLQYDINFLLLRKYSCYATHCIHKDIIRNVFFPKTIRQGEEWLFFYEIGTRAKFYYYNFNSTYVDKNNFKEKIKNKDSNKELDNLELLWKEGIERKINKNITFIVYMFRRFISSIFKV